VHRTSRNGYNRAGDCMGRLAVELCESIMRQSLRQASLIQ